MRLLAISCPADIPGEISSNHEGMRALIDEHGLNAVTYLSESGRFLSFSVELPRRRKSLREIPSIAASLAWREC